MTDNEVYIAIDELIKKFTPLTEDYIYRAYQNCVSLPAKNDFCVMTLIEEGRYNTTVDRFNPLTNEQTITLGMKARVQLDFYGDLSKEYANVIMALCNDSVGCDFLKPYGIQPLYCDNVENMTGVSGEKEYVERNTIEVHLTYKNAVNIGQDGFNTAKINKIRTEL